MKIHFAALAICLTIAATPAVVQEPIRLYQIEADARGPVSSAILQLVSDALRVDAAAVATETLPPSRVAERLRQESGRELVVIAGEFDRLSRLAADERVAPQFARLGLEVLNPRLSGTPLYLIGRDDTVTTIAQGNLRVVRLGYVPLKGELEPADLRILLRPLLNAVTVEAVRVDSPALLASRLLSPNASKLDLAAIYDDEPSVFMERFVSAYRRTQGAGDAARLRAARLLVFPLGQPGYQTNRLQAQSAALSYVIVRYDPERFDWLAHAPSATPGGVLIISRPETRDLPQNDFPLILTNMRGVRGAASVDRLARALGDVYLAALMQAQTYGNRCSGRSEAVYRSYLWNAHLADPADALKVLGFWAHLMLMKSTPAGGTAYADAAALFENRLSFAASMPAQTPEALLRWLAASSPRVGIREQFSGDVSTLYARALEELRRATQAPSNARVLHLRAARGLLFEAARENALPSCAEGGRGLWSANDYDPYFYLAFVDAYLRLTGSR